jgi:membrane-associated phospholipid phosphatase
MDAIHEWGYDVILWMQHFSPELDALAKAVTTLGAEQAFLLILPVVFWCWDKRVGARLGVLLMLSAYVNLALKELFDQPRPSPDRVDVLAKETIPGFPSGHSQNSLVVFGYLAAQISWPWVAAGLIALAVGLSRVYLGVHFPTDVLGGWLIGLAVLVLYIRAEPEFEARVHPWPWAYKIALAVFAPLALFLLFPNEYSAQLMGVLLGLAAGFLVELRWVGFSTGGPMWQRALRFFIGAAILIVVWLGTKTIFPSEPETAAHFFRLLRYALVGGWASLGAPWLFVGVGLAPREREAWD